jgi:hypothetical protein
MHIEKVIPRRYWLNRKTGQEASLYGAVPWTSAAGKPDWDLISDGFTYQWSDGTVGRRPAAATRTEAEQVMADINARCAPA